MPELNNGAKAPALLSSQIRQLKLTAMQIFNIPMGFSPIQTIL